MKIRVLWAAALSFPVPSSGFSFSVQHHPDRTSRLFSKKAQEADDEDDPESVFEKVDPANLPFASTYHAPVMWKECIEGLLSCERAQQPNPLIFVDGTLGGGGHSEALLQRLKPGDVLFGCDVDPKALETASQRLERFLHPSDDQPLFVPVQSNFAQLTSTLPAMKYPGTDDTILNGMNSVDGILLDLGVSSYQIDTPERGFSFMADGPLDMRMMGDSQSTATLTAADLCNELEEQELTRILKKYGDEPRARIIAKSIIDHRPLSTTGQLQEAVAAVVPAFDKKSKRKGRTATLARVFQALRIVVNQEDRVLKQVLEEVCPTLLREGGRLVVLSYHSMEDRATKRVMRDGSTAKQKGSPIKDIYGNPVGPPKPFRPLGKFQKASGEEVSQNSRARSATLRIAERQQVIVEKHGEVG